jgi:hypothetical protein
MTPGTRKIAIIIHKAQEPALNANKDYCRTQMAVMQCVAGNPLDVSDLLWKMLKDCKSYALRNRIK